MVKYDFTLHALHFGGNIMESYVERYTREKREAEQKAQKRKQKEVKKDGKTSRSERQAAPETKGR